MATIPFENVYPFGRAMAGMDYHAGIYRTPREALDYVRQDFPDIDMGEFMRGYEDKLMELVARDEPSFFRY